nr:DMT family transporter [Brevibacillus laterosporus]
MYLVPVTAIVIAMLWIDEGMNIWQACGAFFILLGVGVVRQGEQWLHGWKQRSSSKRQQPFRYLSDAYMSVLLYALYDFVEISRKS